MIKKAIIVAFAMVLSFGVAFATNPDVPETENVMFATITGSVVDGETGDAVPNATVTLNEESATTDEYGTFTFENIDAGSHTITVEAEGYEPAEQTLEVTEEGANVEITLQSAM